MNNKAGSEKPTKDQVTEWQFLLESDLETLLKLIVTFRQPVDEGSVRAASPILRRWLVEGLLGKLCRGLGVKPTFPVLDNSCVVSALPYAKDVDYFLTGGVRFNGAAVSGIYRSDIKYAGKPHVPGDRMTFGLMRLREFVGQKRLFFGGEWFTCEEIVKFVANKLGGVHHDEKRDDRQKLMERASEAMTFGGPPDKIRRGSPGVSHLNVEPEATEVLNGLHIEIIAAAASLLCIHLNGEQLVPITVEQDWSSRISDYLGLKRRKWLNSAELTEGGVTNKAFVFGRDQ